MNNLINLGFVLVGLAACYLLAPIGVKSKINYKLYYFKRQTWIAFHRCPRCNGPVNFDRNHRAHCPNCGRPC